MPGRDPPLVDFESAGYLDAAETFGESDLTLSHTDTEVAAESIRILNHYGTTASQPGGSYTASNDEFGLVINPNTALDGIRVTAAPNTSGVTEIVVAEADTNNELASATGLSFGSGDTVTIPVSLDASTEYAVYAENGTQDDNRSASYPYTSGDVDIVNGWNNGGTISNAGTFSEVTAYFKESDGTSYLGWPHPPTSTGGTRSCFSARPTGRPSRSTSKRAPTAARRGPR